MHGLHTPTPPILMLIYTHPGYCRLFLQSCVAPLLAKAKLPLPPPQLATSVAVVTSLACDWSASGEGKYIQINGCGQDVVSEWLILFVCIWTLCYLYCIGTSKSKASHSKLNNIAV